MVAFLFSSALLACFASGALASPVNSRRANPELPIPNRPIQDNENGSWILKFFVTNMTGVSRFFVESRNEEKKAWKPYLVISNMANKTVPFWNKLVLRESEMSSMFRVRSMDNKTGLSEPSLPSNQEVEDIDTDIAKLKLFTPHPPIVTRVSNSEYNVEWKVPEEWKNSEDYVFSVETLNEEESGKENWEKHMVEFSDGDEDGFIRITVSTNHPELRVKVLGMDYVESLPLIVNLTGLEKKDKKDAKSLIVMRVIEKAIEKKVHPEETADPEKLEISAHTFNTNVPKKMANPATAEHPEKTETAENENVKDGTSSANRASSIEDVLEKQ